MIYFVGAGSGAPDLITVRGARLLSEADVIVYAGSLVNPVFSIPERRIFRRSYGNCDGKRQSG